MQTYLWDITIIMPSDVSSVKKILNSKYTAIGILLIISIGVYLNAIPNEFVYDDKHQVLENQWIKDIRYIPEIFFSSVWSFQDKLVVSNYYRPFMHIIYMINYHIFGLKSWGFHLTNILLHGGVSILVFLILSMLIDQSQDLNTKSRTINPKSKNPKSKSHISNPKSKIKTPPEINSGLTPVFMETIPFIATLLFATHPIHTEAVAWIAGAPELLFSLFYLLSFYLYSKTDRIQDKRFILSLLFFFFATLSKETALTLPILLLVYDYSISRSSVYGSRLTVHGILKRYLPYLIVSIIYFILRIYALGGFAPEKKYTMLSSYELFINIFPLFTQYLEKLSLPINMNAFYVFHPISSILQWKGIIALILTLGFIFLIYVFRRHKIVFLSLLWIVIPLLPVFYIPTFKGEVAFAERYLYLPSVGFVVLVALSIERIYHHRLLGQAATTLIVSILIIMIGLYSLGTIKRNYIWRDDYTLWTDTVKKSSDGYIPHNHLGNIYAEQQRFEDAINEYMTALKLNPDHSEAHNNLGAIYFRQGRLDEAMKEYMIALKLNSGYTEAYYNLGLIYFKQGRFDEAIKEYMAALKLNPEYTEVYNSLGKVYFNKGEIDKAIEHFQSALRLKSDYLEAHYNLGLVYLKTGLRHKAEEEFKTVLKLRPDFTPARETLESINREE